MSYGRHHGLVGRYWIYVSLVEHLRSPPYFGGVRVTRSLVLYVSPLKLLGQMNRNLIGSIYGGPLWILFISFWSVNKHGNIGIFWIWFVRQLNDTEPLVFNLRKWWNTVWELIIWHIIIIWRILNICVTSWAPAFTPVFWWGSCYSIFSFICMFCRSLVVLLYFFLLAIVLSILLRYTDIEIISFGVKFRSLPPLTVNFEV
jgi:hypothetical protein